MRLLEWPVQQGLLAEQGAREARLLPAGPVVWVLRVEVQRGPVQQEPVLPAVRVEQEAGPLRELPVPVLAESAEPVVPLLREPAVREVREVPAVQGAEPLLPAVREVREVQGE